MADKKNKKKKGSKTDVQLLTENSPWQVQEAYKALRTNITFSLPGKDSKIVAMSSAFSHDGKSINAINHAISFGQIDKKVLLIDSDLRLPTCAAKLDIQATPGLSDLLVGEAKVTDCVKHLEQYRIDILPSGNIPPDPTWLLQSTQMELLLKEFRKYYDYIVIDLPPVTTVADASIVAKYVDGFLLVVRHEVTDYRAIADMLGQLRMAEAKILGFIYNDASSGDSRYYRNYYYKSYYAK